MLPGIRLRPGCHTSPTPLKLPQRTTAPASTGNADGQATASATGGNPDFSFRWDNGETAAQAAQTRSGNPLRHHHRCQGVRRNRHRRNFREYPAPYIAIQQTAEINWFR